jgi:hypothetical protein
MAASARIAIELDQPDIVTADHGGEIFTDDLLLIYTRRMERIGAADEADSGWVVEARVSGNRTAKRRNPDGSPKRLRSFGQATYLEGRSIYPSDFPDWLRDYVTKYNPEKPA